MLSRFENGVIEFKLGRSVRGLIPFRAHWGFWRNPLELAAGFNLFRFHFDVSILSSGFTVELTHWKKGSFTIAFGYVDRQWFGHVNRVG